MKIRPISKLPFDWVNDTDEEPLYFEIIDKTKEICVASDFADEDMINATRQDIEFIVHACNNYEKLVEKTHEYLMLLKLMCKEKQSVEIQTFLKELGEIE